MPDFFVRLRSHALDAAGAVVLIVAGAVLTALLFLLRVIPDRDRGRAAEAREEANRRIAMIRGKIAAAKAERDARTAGERAGVIEETTPPPGQSPTDTANKYIGRKK